MNLIYTASQIVEFVACGGSVPFCPECGVVDRYYMHGYLIFDAFNDEEPAGWSVDEYSSTYCNKCASEVEFVWDLETLAERLVEYVKKNPEAVFEKEVLREILKRKPDIGCRAEIMAIII